MSRKSHRTLAVNEIAISDAAMLHLRVLGRPGVTARVIRHVQQEWAALRRRPGHHVVGRLEIGDIALAFVMGGAGSTRAVVVTPVEAAILRARAIDPNAPGQLSRLRPAPLAQEPPPMRTERELNHHVRKHILAVDGEVLDDAELVVALPKRMTKTARGNSYDAERWFWNLRGQEPFVLLIALATRPASTTDIAIAEAFRVPRKEVGARKVLARYRAKKINRTGSFLDRFAVKIQASMSAPGLPAASNQIPPPADS